MTSRLAVVLAFVISAACSGASSSGPSAGAPTSPSPGAGAGPGASQGAGPGVGAPGGADRPCCVPSGVDDPSDDSYTRCVSSGGRPWGVDGCGQRPDGTIAAPPPSVDPG